MPDLQGPPGYELLGVLGYGSGGTVYLGRHLALNRTVAIKRLHPATSPSPRAVRRLRREAQALSRSQHPNVVRIYDLTSHHDDLYLIEEYIDGPTLSQVQHQLNIPTALRVVCELASAVTYLADHGVVHRDLKPENVLLTRTGHVKLSDFGIAKLATTATALTQTGAVIGTADYLSPEAASGTGPITAASDVYSLGAISYELLVGQVPFAAARSVADKIDAHLVQPVPKPTTIVEGFPQALERALLHALEKSPSRRAPTAWHLWTELDEAATQADPEWRSNVDEGLLRRRDVTAAPDADHTPTLVPGLPAGLPAPESRQLELVDASIPLAHEDWASVPSLRPAVWQPPRRPILIPLLCGALLGAAAVVAALWTLAH